MAQPPSFLPTPPPTPPIHLSAIPPITLPPMSGSFTPDEFATCISPPSNALHLEFRAPSRSEKAKNETQNPVRKVSWDPTHPGCRGFILEGPNIWVCGPQCSRAKGRTIAFEDSKGDPTEVQQTSPCFCIFRPSTDYDPEFAGYIPRDTGRDSPDFSSSPKPWDEYYYERPKMRFFYQLGATDNGRKD